MTNVAHLRTEARRYDEASAWLAKLDRGLAAEETAALRAWLHNDSGNARVLMEMARLWDKMDVLSRLSEIFPYSKKVAPKRPIAPWAAAATLLLATLVGVWSFNQSSAPPVVATQTERTSPSNHSYETAVGTNSIADLPDGSRVALNTNTRIDVVYTEHQRIIVLERGEIHVHVAKDRARPLSVLVGDRIVQAIGTAFDVRIDDSQQIELVVTEGIVKVGIRPNTRTTEQLAQAPSATLPETTQTLEEGDRILLGSPTEEVTTLDPDDIEVRLAWRDGNLVFRGESLAVAVAEVSRYTRVEFVLVDDELRKVRVAGLFKAGDVAGFLATLKANFQIVYQRIDDNKIVLSRQAADTD